VRRADDFELIPHTPLFSAAGRENKLSPKHFGVLVCLIVSVGKVVLKEEPLKDVWPELLIEESKLTQHIFRLRKIWLHHHPAHAHMMEG
jgi:DNA-binding winged helix-turn-helix (wHTH) protein